MSYLNTGISWLWYPKDHVSFDFGYRNPASAELSDDEAQFENDFEALADRAVESLQKYRSCSSTLGNAYNSVLEQRKDLARPGGWPDVHLGILAALNERWEQAASLLRFVAEQESETEWVAKQKQYCLKALSFLENLEDLRQWVEANIGECRSLQGLPQIDAPLLPAS